MRVRRLAAPFAAVPLLALALLGSTSPVLAGEPFVKAISVDDYHACALRSDRRVLCWGNNDYHQMGDGTTDQRNTPVFVESSEGVQQTNVASIAPNGYDHTCAVSRSGRVRCWGENAYGNLGNDTTDPSAFPVTVEVAGGAFLDDIKAVTVGQYHSCALRIDGTVWCWGDNSSGQLGDDTTDPSDVAIQVETATGFLSGVKAIGAGWDHTCAVMSNSTVRCWGENEHGQLGDDTTDDRHLPVRVKLGGGFLTDVKSVDGGRGHTCALRMDATLRCWGFNEFGQLGDDTTDDRHLPVRVKRGSGFLTDVTSFAAGAHHTCASNDGGRAFCWGNNGSGELGDGTDEDHHKAQLVKLESSPFTDVRTIRAGDSLSCALKNDRSVWCWGYAEYGQVGSSETPEPSVYYPEMVLLP